MMKGSITGIILAGGKSFRMGSDKGLVMLNGKPFVQHILEALQPLVSKIIVVSDNAVYEKFDAETIGDSIKNAGPLAGLYAGLEHSKTEKNLVLSCDVPLVTTAILEKLLQQEEEKDDIVQLEAFGKTMPLIALYKKRCATNCLRLLNEGERRLRALAENLDAKTIKLDKDEQLSTFNINTIEDLKLAKKQKTHATDH